MDPTKHNYYKKLMKLYEQGRIPTASLTEVDIFHDDWCGVYSGEYCNCDPDIKLRTQRELDGRDIGHTQEGVGIAKGSLDEETRPLESPTKACPHCGSKEFIIWRAANDPTRQAISCDGCGAVMSSMHPLEPEDRPMPGIRGGFGDVVYSKTNDL